MFRFYKTIKLGVFLLLFNSDNMFDIKICLLFAFCDLLGKHSFEVRIFAKEDFTKYNSKEKRNCAADQNIAEKMCPDHYAADCYNTGINDRQNPQRGAAFFAFDAERIYQQNGTI